VFSRCLRLQPLKSPSAKETRPPPSTGTTIRLRFYLKRAFSFVLLNIVHGKHFLIQLESLPSLQSRHGFE
jgi:hypothetical protein